MFDADKWTDKELARLEKRIREQYTQASKELDERAKAYFKKYSARWEKENLAMLTSSLSEEEVRDKWIELYGNDASFQRWYKTANHAYGQTAQEASEAFKRWEYAQLGRGEDWKALQAQMAQRITESGVIAQNYINDVLPSIYTRNNNAIAELGQKAAMEQGVQGVKFDLVDENAVRRLMESSSEVKPYKEVKISLDKDTQYSKNKLQNALLQGILQGDSIGEIATRFQSAVGMSRSAAIRNARTACTAAQNAGKQDRYSDLADKGCTVTKKWRCTHDERTRPEHVQAELDYGTDADAIPYDEYFDVGGEELLYPADRAGSGWNIYNCRCTMATGKIKFHSILDEKTRKEANIRVTDNQNSVISSTGNTKTEKTVVKSTAFSNSNTINNLKKSNVEYKEVVALAKAESFEEIVSRISGGDMTEGSCASVALAYVGRKCGFDVLDFRDGMSRTWFSSKLNKQEMFSELGATSIITDKFKSNLANGKKALKDVSAGEYYLSVGRHAAIIKKDNNGQLQYLELQSRYNNGWFSFSKDIGETLRNRFGCSSSSSWYNHAILTEISQLKDVDGFAELLGYINTSESAQKKGKNGSVK